MKSVSERHLSAPCLSGCAVTVWPVEPKGFTAKLLKRFTAPPLCQAGDTGLPVYKAFYPINTFCEKGTFPGHLLPGLLGSNWELKWQPDDNPVSQGVGLTDSVRVHLSFSIWGPFCRWGGVGMKIRQCWQAYLVMWWPSNWVPWVVLSEGWIPVL